MLTAHHLSKTYGIQPIFQDISFSISAGERIGLVGPNGCGKTTLLRILVDDEKSDEGTVVYTRPNLRIGYLAQSMVFEPGQTLRAALEVASVSQTQLETDIASLATALAKDPENRNLQDKYDSALTQLTTFNAQPEAILGPLGLGDFDLDHTPVSHLSGGQKTRLMLARILLEEPHLLLLDEPTNHLDIAMLEWLEGWLTRFRGAALIVSHDRTFLDNIVTSILELDPNTQTVKSYPGNYSDYAKQKLIETERHQQAYVDQQQQIAQLRAAAAHVRGLTKMRKGGKADPTNTDGFSVGFFGNRATKNVAGRAKHFEARIERILTKECIEKPRVSYQMKLNFGQPTNHSKDVLTTENLSVGYPGHEPLLENVNLYIRAGQRIALIGENGIGKTTLLRTITGALAPLVGSLKLGKSIKLGYMTQEQEALDASRSALESLQGVTSFNTTEARRFLHLFLFSGDDSLRPIGDLSYGERARLQLALLVAQGCTFLVLDEPVNHLDIPSRTRFEQALTQFNGSILAVVHDRYFINAFASDVWTIENGEVIT